MEKTTHSRNEQGMLEVFAGNFPSQEAAEEFMALEDGIPRRFLRELYLREEFTGSIKVVYFDGFPYGDRIIQVLRDKFADKLKRRVNTAIVLYDFNWGYHFTGRPVSVMREKKAQDYHIFYVESVYPYH